MKGEMDRAIRKRKKKDVGPWEIGHMERVVTCQSCNGLSEGEGRKSHAQGT